MRVDYDEMVGRAQSGGLLTPEERTQMIEHTVLCGEGSVTKDELMDLSDRDLAAECYAAMLDYVNTHC